MRRKKRLGKRKRLLKRELLRIKKGLIRAGAKKIIVFGSFSRGVVGRTTDIDMLVVKETNAPFFERLTEIYNGIMPKCAVDILVYTQEELEDMSKWSVFIRKILKEGKVIYAA